MKKSIYIIVLIIAATMMSCKKNEAVTQYDNPHWTLTDKDEYSVSMTAAIQLPENLNPTLTEDDQMIALIGGEIRGVANLYEGIFYFQILASENETGKIVFRYWSGRTQYKYESEESFPFQQDTQLGTPDEPKVLTFKVI